MKNLRRPDLTGAAVLVNVKDEDTFHLTIEEYLLALVSLIEELVSTLTPMLEQMDIDTYIGSPSPQQRDFG
jgi:hypothetical protein